MSFIILKWRIKASSFYYSITLNNTMPIKQNLSIIQKEIHFRRDNRILILKNLGTRQRCQGSIKAWTLGLTTTQLVDSFLPKAGKNFIFKDRINTIKIMWAIHSINKPMKEMSWYLPRAEQSQLILDLEVISWAAMDNKYLKVLRNTHIMIRCKICWGNSKISWKWLRTDKESCLKHSWLKLPISKIMKKINKISYLYLVIVRNWDRNSKRQRESKICHRTCKWCTTTTLN